MSATSSLNRKPGRTVNVGSGTTPMVVLSVGADAATKSAFNMLTSCFRKVLDCRARPCLLIW
jgi:NAD(P)-dependent dehydrogenase (short-subunit alcohol dehydrogenase family)